MKLVLIDRDGVINEEIPGFVTSPAELKIYPRAFDALALLKREGFACVMITNQSVVGRGIITLEKLEEIHESLRSQVERHGGRIDAVFACTDHPDQATERRKPAPGMLLEAMKQYRAKPENTPFIGDATTDMEAASAAGCPRYLVLTGKGGEASRALPARLRPVTVCADILEAANKIVAGQ
ncbi:MAG TPA: HAD-IIIA family hydrolase [Rickettsiales bacterium]|nr:HAD-IIIA family hydrolase [Rickettsiales bacterium]